jgi:F-type H+-transporting ATPase subunit gamma
MEMVAASKNAKSTGTPWGSKTLCREDAKCDSPLAQAKPEYHHPYLTDREAKRVGFIVVTTDRGLCGGLNVNLMRSTVAAMSEWAEKDAEVDLCILAAKGLGFLNASAEVLSVSAAGLGTRLSWRT